MGYMNYGPDAGEPVPSRSPSPRMGAPEEPEPKSEWDVAYDEIANIVNSLLEDRDAVPVETVKSEMESPANGLHTTLVSCTTIENCDGEWVVTGLSHPDDPPSSGTVEYVQESDE